jgi:hypothetical protein
MGQDALMGQGWDWHHDWASLDEVPGASDAWAHHGLAVTAAGSVVGFHARQLVVFDPEGHVATCVETPLFEGHQITLVHVDGEERVWVADPGVCIHRHAGGNLGHGLEITGHLLGEIDGIAGAGRFDCPHAVFVDRRGAQREVYVADRSNARVQVFDVDGSFLRSFGEGVLTSPSSFACRGDSLFVAEWLVGGRYTKLTRRKSAS